MNQKTGHTERGLFGSYVHYDSKGHKTGYSSPRFLGGYNHYDNKNHKTGYTSLGAFGGYIHYDSKGNKTGTSYRTAFGNYVNYDAKGHKTGTSDRNMFGGYTNYKGEDACYIATAVYGSYDCPPVWTLRRFRDQTLKKSLPGRAFVRLYYRLSPALVRRFGQNQTLCRWCRKRLDRLVRYLQRRGYESGFYRDGPERRERRKTAWITSENNTSKPAERS